MNKNKLAIYGGENTINRPFKRYNSIGNEEVEAAKKVKCPTINILGDKDKMCPVKEGKKLADSIVGSQVEIIPNCGHMILLEEADKALAILKKFITTNHPSN
jgi:pimeloyl-ACP methyl ester carboxylesterase